MHTINLFEFSDYEYKDIYAYLMLQNETSFRITMPKHFIAPQEDKYIIATEYYDAIYFGQKLSEFSHDFCYNVPSEYSAAPFTYELNTTEMEKLAETLFYLIRGIIFDSENTDLVEKYWDDKDSFWEQYCNDKVEPACQGLLYIMEKNIQD